MVAVISKSTSEAARLILSGDVIGFPTETVYGLAGLAHSSSAVEKIYAAKGRPAQNPLIVHVSSLDMAQKYGEFSPSALLIARHFWPGPLTIIVPQIASRQQAASKNPSLIAENALANQPNVALRLPAHPVALEVIDMVGHALAAPSANQSGKVSPTSAQHVRDDIGDRIDFILDGGASERGLESTIIKVHQSNISVLRPGSISLEEILDAIAVDAKGTLDPEITKRSDGTIAIAPDRAVTPGSSNQHYAPESRLLLNISDPHKASASRQGATERQFAPERQACFLNFGQVNLGEFNGPTLDLSPSGDLQQAAHNLFDYLRRLDYKRRDEIMVAPIPDIGVGLAINDRLRRAAYRGNDGRTG